MLRQKTGRSDNDSTPGSENAHIHSLASLLATPVQSSRSAMNSTFTGRISECFSELTDHHLHMFLLSII